MSTSTDMAMPKDLRQIVKKARKQGWEFRRAKGGHYHFVAPGGSIYVCSASSSDVRGIRNARAMLIRAGLRLD